MCVQVFKDVCGIGKILHIVLFLLFNVWMQAIETVLETQNSTSDVAAQDPLFMAIEKATNNIRCNLAAELLAMFN